MGYVIVDHRDSPPDVQRQMGRIREYDTLSCRHCQGIIPMAHRQAQGAYCMKCGGPVHDTPRCASRCIPWQRKLEEDIQRIERAARRQAFFQGLGLCLAIIFLFWLGTASAGTAGGVLRFLWDPPLLNTDDSPLTDLSGYDLSYGTSPGSYSTTIDVGNVLTYLITNLTYGTYYYIAVRAYDSTGNRGAYSNELMRLPQSASPPPGMGSGAQ